MSDLIAKVVQISNIRPHPNAEKLDIVELDGWQIVTGKGNYKIGDAAIHVQPETLVPLEVAQRWGVDKYLSWRQNTTLGRVKTVKLRQAPSFGFLAPNETNAAIGENVCDVYGLQKYEEPEPVDVGGQISLRHEDPLFYRYTDIQNLRNYKPYLRYDQELVVTEKLHGMNSRVGFIRLTDEENAENRRQYFAGETPTVSDYDYSLGYRRVVGSHRCQKKFEMAGTFGLPLEKYGSNITNAMTHIRMEMGEVDSVIFYGEIIGPKVQDLSYGLAAKDYRLFDIAVNGKFLDFDYVYNLCKKVDIPTVPSHIVNHVTFEDLCNMAEGQTALTNNGQIKEGIVVRPRTEQIWRQGELDRNPKRVIFKLISSDYLCRKNGTEHH